MILSLESNILLQHSLKKHMCNNETIIEIQKLVYIDNIMFVSTSKSTKIHFYYTFCFLITVVYFSSIVYNVSIAEEDLDEGKHGDVYLSIYLFWIIHPNR